RIADRWSSPVARSEPSGSRSSSRWPHSPTPIPGCTRGPARSSWLTPRPGGRGTDAAPPLTERLGANGFADVPRDVHFFPALAMLAEAVHLLDDSARAEQ